jgi:hypothetical protein
MITSIEISSSAIRCIRAVNGKLASIDQHVIAEGVDPIDALAQAPLPRPLGRVAMVLNHPDLLVRTMVQPPCPNDRLDRIVRFELQAARGEDNQPTTISWHLIKSGGDGDMRVLALMTKSALVTRLKQALATHDGKLAHVVPTGIGLFHAWKRQTGSANEDCVIIDIGGSHVNIALVRQGELLLVRNQGPGMGQLAKDIAEAQGIPLSEARTLATRLGKGSPDSLHDLIKRHTQGIATIITNTIRFAKAQLQLDQYEPKLVYVGGAGAQVHGCVEHLHERLHSTVRLLNPFAGILSTMPSEQLDRIAALPSPLTVALGTAGADAFELDGLQEVRAQRVAYWRTDGALRAACVAAAALILIAAGRQQLALGSANAAVDRLKGADNNGLVPRAEAVAKALSEKDAARNAALERLSFLDGERRPGRIIVELLSAITNQQDSETCPVLLRQYRVLRQGTSVQVEIEGTAESARNKSTADVLRTFERGLARTYQPIGSIVALPKPAVGTAQEFAYRMVIPDQAVDVKSSGSKEALNLTVTADPTCDARGAALVAIDRLRSSETEGTIAVSNGKESQSFTWSARTGLSGKR